jgi:hypothetical protein
MPKHRNAVSPSLLERRGTAIYQSELTQLRDGSSLLAYVDRYV